MWKLRPQQKATEAKTSASKAGKLGFGVLDGVGTKGGKCGN